tara:strand:+ start:869 stop:1513 length:645 start_codon:yes stop_codon:yes gene_type:complete
MAVTYNLKGTTNPYFTLGKRGTTLYQGTSDPSSTYTITDGDIWFDTNANVLKFRSSGSWADNKLDSTSDLAEGTNLYYTDARADARVDHAFNTAKDTDHLSEGSSNLYFTNARADARISASTIIAQQDSSTGAIQIPSGTTAQRPGSPSAGMMRFNTDSSKFEGYNGTDWYAFTIGDAFPTDLGQVSGTSSGSYRDLGNITDSADVTQDEGSIT